MRCVGEAGSTGLGRLRVCRVHARAASRELCLGEPKGARACGMGWHGGLGCVRQSHRPCFCLEALLPRAALSARAECLNMHALAIQVIAAAPAGRGRQQSARAASSSVSAHPARSAQRKVQTRSRKSVSVQAAIAEPQRGGLSDVALQNEYRKKRLQTQTANIAKNVTTIRSLDWYAPALRARVPVGLHREELNRLSRSSLCPLTTTPHLWAQGP